MISSGIFSDDGNIDTRLVESLDTLRTLVAHLRGTGLRISMTSGSFDLIHMGHVTYLQPAKALADVLVVGVDSDARIRSRKGEGRPLVPERERLEMLACQRPVDLLYLKGDDDPKWAMIHAVTPDVLVLSADHSYSEGQLDELGGICGEVRVIPRHEGITTSERIRQIYMHLPDRLTPLLVDSAEEAVGADFADELGKFLPAHLPPALEQVQRRGS